MVPWWENPARQRMFRLVRDGTRGALSGFGVASSRRQRMSRRSEYRSAQNATRQSSRRCHGSKIFSRGGEESETRDAQAQAWHAQERPQRQEGEEPQAGDRDRPVGSPPRRKESAEEEQVEE